MIVGIVNCKKVNIDTKLSRFLGKISYGIYMYHWIIILLALKYIRYEGNRFIFNIELYFTVIAMTILISWISYTTLERFFLNLKKRYETK